MTGNALRENTPLRIAVITVSDRCARGDREDLSGPCAVRALSGIFRGREIEFDQRIVADDAEDLVRALSEFVGNGCDLIFTTGGTGIGPRDITPEATRSVVETEIPGIGEAMRSLSMKTTGNAALSRGLAGISRGTLIVNLPGSPSAVSEILESMGKTLAHAICMMKGLDVHL